MTRDTMLFICSMPRYVKMLSYIFSRGGCTLCCCCLPRFAQLVENLEHFQCFDFATVHGSIVRLQITTDAAMCKLKNLHRQWTLLTLRNGAGVLFSKHASLTLAMAVVQLGSCVNVCHVIVNMYRCCGQGKSSLQSHTKTSKYTMKISSVATESIAACMSVQMLSIVEL